jgi:hypothetical protein
LISAAKHHVRKEILNPKCHGFRGPDLEQERKTERSLTALAATAPVNPSSESATARRAHAPGPDSVASGGGGGGGAVGWVCTERRRRKRGEVEAEVAAESRRAANILVCGRGKKRISPYWATEFWVGETLINPKFASLTSNDIKFESLLKYNLEACQLFYSRDFDPFSPFPNFLLLISSPAQVKGRFCPCLIH